MSFQGLGDQVQQRTLFLDTINYLTAFEKTVPGMLRVGIVQIHNLNNCRVSPLFIDKVVVIQISIELIHRDPRNVEQSLGPFGYQINFVDRFGFHTGLKGDERFQIATFGHPVMVFIHKRLYILISRDQISS